MKIEELRELTSQELRSRGRELKHEVLNLRIQKVTGQLEDRFRVRALRKENARVETILNERRKGITVAAKPAKAEKKEKKAKKAEAKEVKAEKKEEKAPAKKTAKKAAKAAKKD